MKMLPFGHDGAHLPLPASNRVLVRFARSPGISDAIKPGNQMSKRRKPILMGEVERIATATEEPCPSPLTRRLLEHWSTKPASGSTVSITPKCHPTSGMTCGYSWDDGCAVLTCSSCGAGVARLQLANEVPS